MASLFSACKSVVRNNSGGTFNIGGYDIDIEYYGQQDIDDDFRFGNVAFGDSDESKILLVAGSTITIPEGYTLTPDSPKKSLVIFCNDLVNNGTISMYQKAPNVLPHDYFIIEKTYFDSNKDLVIPAYADNSQTDTLSDVYASQTEENKALKNGINGVNRNCGSGGLGNSSIYDSYANCSYGAKSGSGYAFGGGAGTGAGISNTKGITAEACSVDSIYPMKGGDSKETNNPGYYQIGGVGNPPGGGNGIKTNNFGCGGRIIIFCINFINNGNITVNGTDTYVDTNYGLGGASGAGAVDLFYTNLNETGTITANGGKEGNKNSAQMRFYAGKGGDGSITLSQWSQTKLFKTEVKYFSQANVAYLLTQLSDRIKDSRMGE